jgi:hypothetical protein
MALIHSILLPGIDGHAESVLGVEQTLFYRFHCQTLLDLAGRV